MLIRDFISEAIVNSPANLGHFVRSRLARLQAAETSLLSANDALRAEYSRDGGRLFEHLSDQTAYDHYEVEYRIRRVARDINNVVASLKSYSTGGSLHYVISALGEIDIPDGWQANVTAMRGFEAAENAYGIQSEADRSTEEYRDYARMLGAHRTGVSALSEIYAISAELSAKLGVVSDRNEAARNGSHWRPAHDEVETLCHASIFATEITREGFHAEKPETRRGLGLYGSQKGLSMTHSLNVAAQISRCLKEVWLISNGQLTKNAIAGWASSEGIGDKVEEVYRSNGSAEGLVGVLRYYNAYLWMTGIRQNPVFTDIEGLPSVMVGRTLDDIGVLACQVRLSGAEEYKAAESEFVVMPEQVEGVTRRF